MQYSEVKIEIVALRTEDSFIAEASRDTSRRSVSDDAHSITTHTSLCWQSTLFWLFVCALSLWSSLHTWPLVLRKTFLPPFFCFPPAPKLKMSFRVMKIYPKQFVGVFKKPEYFTVENTQFWIPFLLLLPLMFENLGFHCFFRINLSWNMSFVHFQFSLDVLPEFPFLPWHLSAAVFMIIAFQRCQKSLAGISTSNAPQKMQSWIIRVFVDVYLKVSWRDFQLQAGMCGWKFETLYGAFKSFTKSLFWLCNTTNYMM